MELIKVIKADYLEEYKIEITFSDGIKSIIDFKNELWGEVFEPIKDLNNFRNFTLNPFTIQWENGADFAPECLYKIAKNKQIA